MNQPLHSSLVSFIWNIADDVLHHVFNRTRYRDVILPMTVLRRLDCLLEPTKKVVLDQHRFLNDGGIVNQDTALQHTAKQKFYNISRWTLKELLDEPTNVVANFDDYLEGFSPNVQGIVSALGLREQIKKLVHDNKLYLLIQKFVDPKVYLSPEPLLDKDGNVVHEGLTNLGMGYVFEELIRRFSEDNNDEAGEHYTPRDIIELMASLIFLPIKDEIPSGGYMVYDPACGTGGMLTESERFLTQFAGESNKRINLYLFGQELNRETHAICQSDILIKGYEATNIKQGSTLANDQCAGQTFDFMLSNPPYGSSWIADEPYIRDKHSKEVTDPRFAGIGVPRTSDGQLLFLVHMLRKMKTETATGARVATVHNGSALFTGDAGQGESEIRKWIIENDYLEAIVGLPLNIFYNTGIATYVWLLTNRKPAHRKKRVQLIDATQQFAKLRKNLGSRNCELKAEHVAAVVAAHEAFADSETSRVFDNDDFGYRKITVERPLRLAVNVNETTKAHKDVAPFLQAVHQICGVGEDAYLTDYNDFRARVKRYLSANKIKASATQWKAFDAAITERDENAAVVTDATGKPLADPALRDTENVPLKDDVQAFFDREVKQFAPDAWIDPGKTVVGYEISFTKTFYKYQPLRCLSDITRDIRALEAETDGLLHEIAEIK